jgi:hypothetical protein
MYLLLHHAELFVLPLGVAWLMMLAGVQKNALEWRRRARICPSCDRDLERCRCRD